MSINDIENCDQDLSFGIDQSLNSTAYCITSKDGNLVDFGLIRVNPSTHAPNKKLDVPQLHPALEILIDPEEWIELSKNMRQFYIAKAVSNRLVAKYSKFMFQNGFYENDHNINVCIEGIAASASGDATRGLAGLQFLIMSKFLDEQEDDFMELKEPFAIDVVPPTTVKKFATDNGRADKEDVFEALPSEVKEKFSEYPKTKGRYDLADAYWISMYGHKVRGEKNET